ncbi:protein-arginine deiminase family protein [Streptomyces carpaticus]|uniref:Protein-arginine deiminase family protein n=1 Tax=Streptomyces carpaticus TaxID=285558 RepID=A0ABV4ZS11_9ACTN
MKLLLPARRLRAAAATVSLAALAGTGLTGCATGPAAPTAVLSAAVPLVLPNLDDSAGRCPALGADGERLSDDALAACHDAADERVSGPEDALDLAPLEVAAVPDAGEAAYATVTVDAAAAPYTRLFVRDGDTYTPLGPDGRLAADRLRAGVHLALEATDPVRDPAVWDGTIDVTLEVTDGGRTARDAARLRVAPLILTHDLLPLDRLVISDNGTSPQDAEREGYDPTRPAAPVEKGEDVFRTELTAALEQAGLEGRLMEYPTGGDRWMRDQFITGYFAVPTPDGGVRRMSVLLRSADVMPEGSTAEFPLRDAGRPAFSVLRGPGTAVLQEYTAERVGDGERAQLWGSFSSTGNFLVAPPDEQWPAGRVLYGSDGGDAAPDAAFVRLLEAQREQAPLAVDTSWLGVGHIDEFLSFVPAGTPRGWAAVVADPERGLELAESDDPAVLAGTRLAVAGVDAALEVLRTELALTDEEIIRVPALFERLEVPGYPRQDIVANALPAVVNGVETGTGTGTFLAPDPRHAGFRAATEEAFAAAGASGVAWVDAWEYAFAVGTVGGDLHCVTNALRDLSAAGPWWEK